MKKKAGIKTLTIPVSPPEPYLLAQSRIHTHFGHFFKPNQVPDSKSSFRISGEIPIRIRDERSDTTKIVWLTFDDLGTIHADPKTGKVKAPSVSSVLRAANDRYRDTTNSIEADLIYAGSGQFGSLTYSKVYLQPLGKIIGLLEDRMKGVPLGRVREAVGDKAVAERHLGYLLGSEYARVQKETLVPTQKFVVARQKQSNLSQFISEMVGVVLALLYDRVTQDIPMVKAYVRAGMAFYRPAVEFGEMVAVTPDVVFESYRKLYQPSQKIRDSFQHVYFHELVDHNILHYDKGLVTGDREIFPVFKERATPKLSLARGQVLLTKKG